MNADLVAQNAARWWMQYLLDEGTGAEGADFIEQLAYLIECHLKMDGEVKINSDDPNNLILQAASQIGIAGLLPEKYEMRIGNDKVEASMNGLPLEEVPFSNDPW